MSNKESVEVDFEALGKALAEEIWDHEFKNVMKSGHLKELAELITGYLQNNLFVKIRRETS